MNFARTLRTKHKNHVQAESALRFYNDLEDDVRTTESTDDSEAALVFPSSLLCVKVSHANGLLAMDSNGKSDPFCVIQVGDKKQKTSTKPETLDPVWNETFAFSSYQIDKAEGIIKFELYDKDQWTKDDFLGKATLNVYETLKSEDKAEELDLKLMQSPKRRLHVFHHREDRDLGHVNVSIWWNRLDPGQCISDDTRSFINKSTKIIDSSKILKTNVVPCVRQITSLPCITHSARGSVYEEPAFAVLIFKVSQVEIKVDPTKMTPYCSTSCILRSKGRAAKKRVSQVLGNLIPNRRFMTSFQASFSRTETEMSSISMSQMATVRNNLLQEFLEDEKEEFKDDESNDTDSEDEHISVVTEVDLATASQWYCEIEMSGQKRRTDSISCVVNAPLPENFMEPVTFLVQLPLPNEKVSISLCKKSNRRRRTFQIPFGVPLFDIMDAANGVEATHENGSTMLIHYHLICLDERPSMMKIPIKLEHDESKTALGQWTIPEERNLDISAIEQSELSSSSSSVFTPSNSQIEDTTSDIIIGNLRIFLEGIELTQLKPNVHTCFCILKCRHHWAMTTPQMANASISWNWLLKLPLYDPATLVSLSVFGETGRHSQSVRLGKLRIRLSTLQPGKHYESELPFVGDGIEIGKAKLSLKINYPSISKLYASYIKDPFDHDYYLFGLTNEPTKSMLRKEHRRLITQWLNTSDPGIATAISKQVLDLEKETFSRKRFAMHIRRLQHCFAFLSPISEIVGSLQRWDHPIESTGFCIGIWLAAYNLETVLVLGLLFAFWMMAIHYKIPSCPSSMVDPILLPPTSEPVEQPQSTSENQNPYSILKSRYDKVQTTIVKIQKILDSIATVCERIHCLLTWKDPVATQMFTICLLLAICAISFLGVRICLCFGLCWMFRPPFLRKPTPPPPSNFFHRLPSRSDQIL